MQAIAIVSDSKYFTAVTEKASRLIYSSRIKSNRFLTKTNTHHASSILLAVYDEKEEEGKKKKKKKREKEMRQTIWRRPIR